MGNYIKKEIGITLIALVITIIVMLILVTVTIRISQEGSLFKHAANAVTETKKAVEGENTLLEGNVVDKTIEEVVLEQTGNRTYTAYEVGDTITISGESFYVIEDSDEHTSTVKLLAAINVDANLSSGNHNKQDLNAEPIAFDGSSPYTNDYNAANDPPTIKGNVNSYVSSLGVTVQEGRLMLENEADALKAGHTNILYATNYWLGSSIGPDEAAYIVGDGSPVDNGSVEQDGIFGLRPLIVILKDNIPAQD